MATNGMYNRWEGIRWPIRKKFYGGSGAPEGSAAVMNVMNLVLPLTPIRRNIVETAGGMAAKDDGRWTEASQFLFSVNLTGLGQCSFVRAPLDRKTMEN